MSKDRHLKKVIAKAIPPRMQVNISQELLRKYPNLSRIPPKIERASLNSFIEAIERRPEGMKVSIDHGMVNISPKERIIQGKTDFLGLEVPDEQLNDICDVIRDETSRYGKGTDPRREVYYSKKGSIYEGFTDDILIEPNYIPSKGERKRHPLDRVSCEEVVQRRDLAEKRWSNHEQGRFKRKSKVTDEKELNNAMSYFFPEKK